MSEVDALTPGLSACLSVVCLFVCRIFCLCPDRITLTYLLDKKFGLISCHADGGSQSPYPLWFKAVAQPPIDMSGNISVHMSAKCRGKGGPRNCFRVESKYFFELGAHAKFQNPTPTPFLGKEKWPERKK